MDSFCLIISQPINMKKGWEEASNTAFEQLTQWELSTCTLLLISLSLQLILSRRINHAKILAFSGAKEVHTKSEEGSWYTRGLHGGAIWIPPPDTMVRNLLKKEHLCCSSERSKLWIPLENWKPTSDCDNWRSQISIISCFYISHKISLRNILQHQAIPPPDPGSRLFLLNLTRILKWQKS